MRRTETVDRRILHGVLMLAAALVAAVAVAACGSSSSSGGGGGSSGGSGGTTAAANTTAAGGTGTSGGGTASTPASTGGSGSGSGSGGQGKQSVTNYLAYAGGKAGPAKKGLAPVVIGWVNQQGGTQQVGPLATVGAQTAVKYINSKLGGVDGHPVELKTCFIQSSDQQGQTCAQQMLADKQVKVIDVGAVAIGIQPFYATLRGAKPVIDGVTTTPTDAVQKNAVIYFGDSTHVLGPFGTYAKNVLHAKTAALVYPNIAGITEGAQAIERSLKLAGIQVKAVSYDESQTDLTGTLTSAGVQTADMVIPYSDSSGCVNLAKGLQSLGVTDVKKIVSAPLCLNGQVAAGLGGSYPKWTYAIASSLYGDPTDPGMPAYMKATTGAEPAADAPDPWNIVAFSQILTTVKLMNQIGYAKLSPNAILTRAKTFKGPLALGAPALDCGKYPSAAAVCNDRAQFFEYEGGKKFVKAAGWLQPPPGD